MENKSDRNDNIVILRDFNCTINKMEKDDGNKIQRLHGCGSIYFLSKLIVDKRLEDLYRRKNLDSLDFTNSDRSSGTRCKIVLIRSVLIKQLLTIPKLIRWCYSLLIIIMQYLLIDSPEKLKVKDINDTLMSLFYVSTGFPQLQKIFFLLKILFFSKSLLGIHKFLFWREC